MRKIFYSIFIISLFINPLFAFGVVLDPTLETTVVGGDSDTSLLQMTDLPPITGGVGGYTETGADDFFPPPPTPPSPPGSNTSNTSINSSFGDSDLITLIDDLVGIINRLLVVVVGLAVLVFIWGIIRYLYSAEDAKAREEWRKYMIYGVLAITVIVGFWGIVNAVLNMFGIGFRGPQF